MLYVICYDVSDDRRRAKVHAVLSGYGAWTQYSLFECYLTRQELVLLRARLAEVIRHREDTIRLYALCEGCRNRVEVLGHGEPPKEPTVYLI
jgi:CRISPR-associated protein Cas2